MSKSELFPNLNDIDFAVKDTDTIIQEVIARYETISGRSLARADPVRLFLNAVILEIAQQRSIIDFSAKMNLLAYASGDYLDHLGALLGVTRLEASYATCNVKFTLSTALPYDVIIPEGTRITPDGKILFALSDDISITAGQLYAVASAACLTSGTVGNDYVAGQINQIVDVFPYELKAVNITASAGGDDTETDDDFRARIQLAPESFTNAGSIQGYKYFALSADPNIADVAVITPPDTDPGNVNIYVLMNGGILPDDDVLAKVLAVCSGDDVRPDTDYVHALKPETVSYSIEVSYWISSDDAVQSEVIQANVQQAVADFITWQASKLGRDINPSKLHHDIIEAGAKRCEIISPSFQVLSLHQCAVTVTSLSIVFQGLES